MNPATAVTWGPFIQAAYNQYVSDPGQANPATVKNMPAGYTLTRTIQMTDSFGPVQARPFYGFVAVGGTPTTAVVALRGTATTIEWWEDFQWDLVPFTQVSRRRERRPGIPRHLQHLRHHDPGPAAERARASHLRR
jgi:hypothetical protein